jgi:spore photoproduct lyase
MITQWKPSEIVIHRKVENDPVTLSIISQCEGIPIRFVSDANPKSVVQASEILNSSGDTMLDKILAGKQVLFVSPATGGEVDRFEMKDDRMLCPHFQRLKYAV